MGTIGAAISHRDVLPAVTMAVSDSLEMDLPADLRDLIDDLHDSANARAVFGDPVERGDRTVIPVARIAYGFGGGFGAAPGLAEEPAAESDEELTIEAVDDVEDVELTGSGGGGGAMAKPVGALEITDHETRFVPISGNRVRLFAVLGLGIGFVLGRLLGRRAGQKAARRAQDIESPEIDA